jgi:hypothetical protein
MTHLSAYEDPFSKQSQFSGEANSVAQAFSVKCHDMPTSSGKMNAVTEMNLEKPQVSRTIRSGPALPEIRRRRIDDKVILPIKPNFSAGSRNQDTSIRHDYLFSEETTFLWGMHSCLQPSFRRRVPGKGKIK